MEEEFEYQVSFRLQLGSLYDVMVDGVLWKASRTRSQEYSVQIELSQKREKSLVAMVEGVDVRRGVKQSTRKFISLPKKKQNVLYLLVLCR